MLGPVLNRVKELQHFLIDRAAKFSFVSWIGSEFRWVGRPPPPPPPLLLYPNSCWVPLPPGVVKPGCRAGVPLSPWSVLGKFIGSPSQPQSVNVSWPLRSASFQLTQASLSLGSRSFWTVTVTRPTESWNWGASFRQLRSSSTPRRSNFCRSRCPRRSRRTSTSLLRATGSKLNHRENTWFMSRGYHLRNTWSCVTAEPCHVPFMWRVHIHV